MSVQTHSAILSQSSCKKKKTVERTNNKRRCTFWLWYIAIKERHNNQTDFSMRPVPSASDLPHHTPSSGSNLLVKKKITGKRRRVVRKKRRVKITKIKEGVAFGPRSFYIQRPLQSIAPYLCRNLRWPRVTALLRSRTGA